MDPAAVEDFGVDLEHLLWIRFQRWPLPERITPALKALDILARSQSFGVIVLDLDPTSDLGGKRDPTCNIPFNVWFRLKQIIQGKKTTILILSRRPTSGSASSVVLELNRCGVRWYSPAGSQEPSARTRLLRGISSEVCLLRGKGHGRVKVHSDFWL